jgi:hypothetical protein
VEYPSVDDLEDAIYDKLPPNSAKLALVAWRKTADDNIARKRRARDALRRYQERPIATVSIRTRKSETD